MSPAFFQAIFKSKGYGKTITNSLCDSLHAWSFYWKIMVVSYFTWSERSGKCNSFQLLQQLFATAGMWVTNTLGIMLQILNNYPWPRLAVRIIEAIKKRFFHVFNNSNLSEETFAIDNWRIVIFSLGHGHKHIFTIPLTTWRPGLKLYQFVLQSSYFWIYMNIINTHGKWMVSFWKYLC